MRGEARVIKGVSAEVASVAVNSVWDDVRAMVGASVYSDVVTVRELARELTQRGSIERSAAVHCAISYFLDVWELANFSNEFDPVAELEETVRPEGLLGVCLVLLHLYTGAMGVGGSSDRSEEMRDKLLNSLGGLEVREEVFYGAVVCLATHCADLIRSWSEASGRELEELTSKIAMELRVAPRIAG